MSDVKYQMAADPLGVVSRFFGVYNRNDGTAMRGTFIINPDGVLVSSEISYHNIGRSGAELLRKVQAHVHLRENPNEACPANWNPNDSTLTPSEALVGRVYEALNK